MLHNKQLRISSKRAMFLLPMGLAVSFSILLLAFYFLKREISLRVLAEESLRKSNKELRILIDNIPAVVFKGDKNGNINYASNRIEEMFGYSKDDFESSRLKWIPLILKEDIEHAKNVFIDALKRNKSYQREYRIRNKDGQIVWIQERSHIICSQKGEIESVNGVFFDITEMKEKARVIDQLRDRLQLILDSAWEGVIGLDIHGNITFINQAAAGMLGYEPGELIGRHAHSTWHHSRLDGSPYPEDECPVHATFREGTVHHIIDEVFWRKDGTGFHVAYSSTPTVEYGAFTGTVLTFWDITEQKRTEKEREELIGELQDALAKVKLLSGFLPICASCKNIRDDQGYWRQIESYIRDHSEAEFSHSICPECARKLYPEFYKENATSQGSRG